MIFNSSDINTSASTNASQLLSSFKLINLLKYKPQFDDKNYISLQQLFQQPDLINLKKIKLYGVNICQTLIEIQYKTNNWYEVSLDKLYVNKDLTVVCSFVYFYLEELREVSEEQCYNNVKKLLKFLGLQFTNIEINSLVKISNSLFEIENLDRNEIQDIFNLRDIEYCQPRCKVYKAQNKSLIIDYPQDQNIILKFTDEGKRKYQDLEISILEKCKSNFLPEYYGYFRYNQIQVIFMKKYTESYFSFLKRNQKLLMKDPNLKFQFGTQMQILFKKMAISLDQVYKQLNIVHRDIKPQNIMLDYQNLETNEDYYNVKVIYIDFDRSIDEQTNNILERSTQYEGTSPYLPPEKYQATYDQSFDIWQLGLVYLISIKMLEEWDKPNWQNFCMKKKLIYKENITNGEYSNFLQIIHNIEDKIDVKEGFKQLINQMLLLNPQQRPSVQQVINFFN